MMRKLEQTTAVLLAFIMLLSTLSFSVDMHFCGDHLVDFSFTKQASTCSKYLPDSDQSRECPMAAMNCCTDLSVVHKGQDELQFNTIDLSFEQIAYFILIPPPGISQLFTPVPGDPPFHFIDCTPPPLIRKLHLLNETFLI